MYPDNKNFLIHLLEILKDWFWLAIASIPSLIMLSLVIIFFPEIMRLKTFIEETLPFLPDFVVFLLLASIIFMPIIFLKDYIKKKIN